jgi:hypothetical protein
MIQILMDMKTRRCRRILLNRLLFWLVQQVNWQCHSAIVQFVFPVSTDTDLSCNWTLDKFGEINEIEMQRGKALYIKFGCNIFGSVPKWKRYVVDNLEVEKNLVRSQTLRKYVGRMVT